MDHFRRSFAFLVVSAVSLRSLSAADTQPVARVALIKDGAEQVLADTAKQYSELTRQGLAKYGISNLKHYKQALGKHHVVIRMYDLAEKRDDETAWKDAYADKDLKSWLSAIDSRLDPHPRFKEGGGPWAMCETVCALRPARPELAGAEPAWHASVVGLKLDKEFQYRALHNHVWPGVVKAIGDAGMTRFDIFLIEFGEEVYLFSHFRYQGKDMQGDFASMGDNPVNRRWWALTDPCQIPLPEAAAKKEIWTAMKPAAVFSEAE